MCSHVGHDTKEDIAIDVADLLLHVYQFKMLEGHVKEVDDILVRLVPLLQLMLKSKPQKQE
jgi:hypothetical protein